MDFGTPADRGLDCSLRLAGIKALGCVWIAAAMTRGAFAFARESARGVLAKLTESLAEAQRQSLRDFAFRLNQFVTILVTIKMLRRPSHHRTLHAGPERRLEMQAEKAGFHLSLVDTQTAAKEHCAFENDYLSRSRSKRQRRKRRQEDEV